VKRRERIKIAIQALKNQRLRRDIRAFKIAAVMYPYFAWKIFEKIGLDSILKTGNTIDEICKKTEIKNTSMLEYMLDLMVGRGVLSFSKGKYKFINPPDEFKKKDEEFLKSHYPYSWEWTMKLVKNAEKALLNNQKFEESGFESDEGLRLWDGIMSEAPHSFRNMAIKTCLRYVKDGSSVLDLGCGGGIGLEIFLLLCKKKIKLYGIDGSKQSLNRAKKRIEEIYINVDEALIKQNIEGLELIKRDLRKKGLPKDTKYDVIFLSIVLNHIPKTELGEFLKELRGSLKKNGVIVIYQLIHKSKFERVPMWVMELIPTHKEYPFKDQYIEEISQIFNNIEVKLDGSIIIGKR